MKCQQCEKPATFHITELTDGQPQELHLCETCAKTYLTQGEPGKGAVAPTLANVLAKQLQIGKAAEELAKLDQRACPVCGITFYEFRNQGRLGCPHDYVFFEKELTPLIANIHGETQHVGKRPRGRQGGTDEQTELIRLRREMKEATQKEEYERAAEIRDQILALEKRLPQSEARKQGEASGRGEIQGGAAHP
ncbi:MAG TPA: UvrB/UvrC motif-containing protein [Pirellulaceae bacterium]|jgi:protein arginine kinase activator